MSNTSSVPPIYISFTAPESSSNQDGLSLQILFICIPIIFVPLVGLVSWFVRGHYERQNHELSQHKEDKKKYLIENIQTQIKFFYWPLYLNLIRYQQLLDRYKEFKAGHFSLSTVSSPDFLKQSPLNKLSVGQIATIGTNNSQVNSIMRTFDKSPRPSSHKLKLKLDEYKSPDLQLNPARMQTLANIQKQFVANQTPIIEEPHTSTVPEIKIDIHDPSDASSEVHVQVHVDISSSNGEIEQINSNSDSNKDIKSEKNTLITNPPKKGGMGISNAIKIIDKFNKAIREYENKMTQTLKDMQKIYTDSVAIADPSFELLRELVKLDEYVTYIITFRDVSHKSSTDAVLEEKIERAKFPSRINELVDAQLSYLQALCKDLVNNRNSSVLETQGNLTQAPVSPIFRFNSST
jgi:hypothetical protein